MTVRDLELASGELSDSDIEMLDEFLQITWKNMKSSLIMESIMVKNLNKRQ